MARHYNVNNAYTTAELGPYPLFDLKTLMIAHGWVVGSSSDGTANFGSADYITTVADLTNLNSWMVLHHTASKREWLFGMHNDATYNEWYIGYSANVGGVAGFTGGTLTAMPAATDEVALRAERAVTPIDLWPAYDCYCHVMVDDASSAFYLLSVMQRNHLNVGCISGDPLTGTHTLDTDPYVANAHYYGYTSGFTSTTSAWGSNVLWNRARGWYKYPTGSAELIFALFLMTGSSTKTFAPANKLQNGGKSPYDFKDVLFPVLWGRSSYHASPIGVKGVSTLFHNVTTQRFSGDILTVGSEKMFLTGVGKEANVAIPWDPTAKPL